MDFFECLNHALIWIEQHQGLASWIQALGSIGAIVGAYYIAQSQAKKQLFIAQEQSQAQIQAMKEQSEEQSKNAIDTVEKTAIKTLILREKEANEKLITLLFSMYVLVGNIRETLDILSQRNGEFYRDNVSQMLDGYTRRMEQFPIFEFPIPAWHPYIVELPTMIKELCTMWKSEAETYDSFILNIAAPNSNMKIKITQAMDYCHTFMKDIVKYSESHGWKIPQHWQERFH